MKQKFLTLFAAVVTLLASAQTVPDYKSLKGKINLMVVTDLGRNGYYDQKPIASLMGAVAEQTGPDAVIALGDTHHYQGIQSVDDPLWMTNYELIYSHPELQVEWYPVLGNHEYRGNSQAVIDYSAKSRRWEIPSRYYTKTFEDGGTSLRIVFIDTAPLIDKYRKKNHTYPDAEKQDMEAQLEWLDKTLGDAKEEWIIVAGHHPIYAYTDKEESERTDMQKRVDGILRKHNVDIYICGHLHNFQHIRKAGSDIDYVVNTSGSLSRAPEPVDGTVFCNGDTGISFLTASKDTLTLNMINREGKVLHKVQRHK